MILKSKEDTGDLPDLCEMFSILRNYRTKLKPKKYIFEVRFAYFLGFMISSLGINVNLDKLLVVLNVKAPRSLKEVQ